MALAVSGLILLIIKGQPTISTENWASIVKRVVTILDENNIQYHIDASSSLYVQGVDFEMDDLDITVKWGSLQQVAQLFKGYSPTNISSGYPPSVKFMMEKKVVHVMSYQSESGIGEAEDRLQVDFNGVTVWCKTIEFYQKHMEPAHRLNAPLQHYLKHIKH